jgi:hypothetical protein
VEDSTETDKEVGSLSGREHLHQAQGKTSSTGEVWASPPSSEEPAHQVDKEEARCSCSDSRPGVRSGPGSVCVVGESGEGKTGHATIPRVGRKLSSTGVAAGEAGEA